MNCVKYLGRAQSQSLQKYKVMKPLGFSRHVMQLCLPSSSAALSKMQHCMQMGKLCIPMIFFWTTERIIWGGCSDDGSHGGSALQRRAVSNRDCL